MKEQLRKFIIDNYLFGQDLEFSDDDSFQERGIVDSTGVLELVAFLEERYGIEIADDEFLPENLDSINCLVRFLSARLTSPQPGSSLGAMT